MERGCKSESKTHSLASFYFYLSLISVSNVYTTRATFGARSVKKSNVREAKIKIADRQVKDWGSGWLPGQKIGFGRTPRCVVILIESEYSP